MQTVSTIEDDSDGQSMTQTANSFNKYLVMECDIDDVIIRDAGQFFDGGCVTLTHVVTDHTIRCANARATPGDNVPKSLYIVLPGIKKHTHTPPAYVSVLLP